MDRKNLNKYLTQVLKPIKKSYGFKSREGTLFKQMEDYFLTISIYVTGMKGNKLSVNAYVKPYIIDDLFWDVFDMRGNKDEPMSLRATGAFTFDSLLIYNNTMIISDYDQVMPFVNDEIKKMMAIVNTFIQQYTTLEDFYLYSQTIDKHGLYDVDLMFMLTQIYQGNYIIARQLAEERVLNNNKGRFAQGSKYIYEYVIDYCLERENK